MSAARARKVCPRCGGAFEDDATYCPNDGAELLPKSEPSGIELKDPYIGVILEGGIEILSVAGSGAMGRVYRAHQRGVDRDVAVKILHRELSGNLPLVQRFHREAKIASKLQHPHVVEVYLAGQLPDGALYMVMEYLDGMSLAAALSAAGGALPLERAIPIALQICDAVGEAHMRKIVHRDLKPENVMLVRRADTGDWVKVLDFGIAKVSLGEQSMETAAGLIFGTARYISPEGAHGETVGPPGDVYAIATMVYQLLAGRTPFDAEKPLGLLIKHIHETPPDLRSWPCAANVPEPIARVILDNLAKDPAHRAPNARAFGNALNAAAKRANVSFSDVGVVARMSVIEGPRPVERTLDDAVAMSPPAPASKVDSSVEAFAETSPVEPAPREEIYRSTRPGPKSDAPPSSRVGRAAARRSGRIIILLAFLLGVAGTVLVMQHLAQRRDAEHDAHVMRARRALTAGHYVDPPEDNVRELVASGLRRWPDDHELAQVRSDAAHELVTRAMAARSAGDLVQARDLVKSALEFDASDHAAALLLDQYEDELRLTADDAGSGAPRVLIDVPATGARRGVAAALTARVSVAGGPPKSPVNDPRFTITGPGLPAAGTVVPAKAGGRGVFIATIVPTRDGRYAIVFEANTDGIPFRAERELSVAK